MASSFLENDESMGYPSLVVNVCVQWFEIKFGFIFKTFEDEK